MSPPAPIFDARIHAGPLPDRDLRDLAFFGVDAAVAVCGDDAPEGSAEDYLAYVERLLDKEAKRLRQAKIAAFFAVGVHPKRVPERGLATVLGRLPRYFSAARVVAVGSIGLDACTPLEEEAFLRQLELAENLALPVVLHTPERNKQRILRRTLSLLRESGIEPERVLAFGADATTIRLIRSCGHVAGLLVHPARLRPEQAVELIRLHGSEGLILASDAGAGPSDLIALPRTVALLARAGISQRVAARVARDNALAFYRIDPAAL